MKRSAILAEGSFVRGTAKTAIGLLRYRRDVVVAVIDSTRARTDAFDCVGEGRGVPVVASLAEARPRRRGPRHRHRRRGWQGPRDLGPILEEALRAGMDLVNGLHTRLADDPRLRSAAAASGARIHDVRRPPEELPVPALKVEFVEQPLPPGDLEGLRAVRSRSRLPIVVDESVVRASDFAKVAGLAHGVKVKLQKCGGIAEARDLIAAAPALGLRVMLGCRAAESSVAIAAAAHLAPLADWADLDGNLLVVDGPFAAVEVRAGRFVYPERAGLGALRRAPARPAAVQ